MVIACVRVNSKADIIAVGKLSIVSRGPFKIVEDCSNGSYSVQPFDKPDAAIRKFLGQDLYALPPQILSCDEVDLVDLRYLNSDFTAVQHPFKQAFDMESYNSIWFDKQPPSNKPLLSIICKDSLPPAVEQPSQPVIISTGRPDTVEEMDIHLTDNTTRRVELDAIVTEIQKVSVSTTPVPELHQQIIDSGDKVFFVSYSGANTLRPRWYLV